MSNETNETKAKYIPIKGKKGKGGYTETTYIFAFWHNGVRYNAYELLTNKPGAPAEHCGEGNREFTGAFGKDVAALLLPDWLTLHGIAMPESVEAASLEAAQRIADRKRKAFERETEYINKGLAAARKDGREKAATRWEKVLDKHIESADGEKREALVAFKAAQLGAAEMARRAKAAQAAALEEAKKAAEKQAEKRARIEKLEERAAKAAAAVEKAKAA